jgi:hypothetical protein
VNWSRATWKVAIGRLKLLNVFGKTSRSFGENIEMFFLPKYAEFGEERVRLYAFSNSIVSKTFLNSLPGLKRGKTLLIWLERTASAVSAHTL